MKQYLFVGMALCYAGLFVADVVAEDNADQKMLAARDHIQHGRYDEALEILDPLAKAKDADVVELTLARCAALHAQGQLETAEELLSAALKQHPKVAALHAELSQLHFERGRWKEAAASVEAALKIDSDQLLARLIQAHLWAEQGEIKLADDGYRWFVRYYNRRQPHDAESLLLVCRGASQYARWHSVTQIFDFCVNTLCPDALKVDKESWQARYMAGRLLLEKYNKAQGQPELKAALAWPGDCCWKSTTRPKASQN